MIDKAIEKITKEAMALDDPMAFAIEEHLTDLCTSNTVAMKILAEDKSLKGACDMLWREASKRKKGNHAYIPPAEAFEMIDKYYGITSQVSTPAGRSKARTNVLDLI